MSAVRVGRALRVFGIRDTPAAKGPVTAAVDLRVKAPALCAVAGVKGYHAVEWGAVNEAGTRRLRQQNGRGLGRRVGHVRTVLRAVAAAECPRHFQPGHVAGIDVIGRAVVAPPGIATVHRPVVRQRRAGQRCKPEARAECKHAAVFHGVGGVMRSSVGWPPSVCQLGKWELLVYTAPSFSDTSTSRVKKRCRGMG